MQNLNFKILEAGDLPRLEPYFQMRSNLTCDSTVLDSFLWQEYYQAEFVIVDDRAVLMKSTLDGRPMGALPICRKEDMAAYFRLEEQYFNQVLGEKFEVLLADEAGVEALGLDPARYEVVEEADAADYIYDAEGLRTLAGKKYHKKKNHVNAFRKEYEGRFEYRALTAADKCAVWHFLDFWEANHGDDAGQHLEGEIRGIHDLLNHMGQLQAQMAGVFVDGALQAFTVGSYNPVDKMAVIHIEKANADIRGLYPFINQQFLVHEYPDAVLVNREDDVGLESLRKAKLSYHPIMMARKYSIHQK